MFSEIGKNLQILKLDENGISNLPRFALSGLVRLSELSLRENRISCISNDTFVSNELTQLRKLDFYGNSLEEIGTDTLKPEFRIFDENFYFSLQIIFLKEKFDF